MSVKLVFRRGSFLQHMYCDSLDEAYSRVGEFIFLDCCSDFRVVDDDGHVIHDDSKVRTLYMNLWNGWDHKPSVT